MAHWIFFEPSFEPENQKQFYNLVESYEILRPGEKPRHFYNTNQRKGILWASLDNKPPGCTVYGKPENLKCSDYYPRVSNLLNETYILVDTSTFLRNKDFYFDALGDTCFVRPDGGSKFFDGCVISRNTTRHTLHNLIFCHYNRNLLLAPTKNILDEYRFVIVDGEIITGSMYKTKVGPHLEFEESVIAPISRVWAEAEQLLPDYQPAKAFTMDIAALKEGYKIVELNSFSHAGLYSCDIKRIVEALDDKN